MVWVEFAMLVDMKTIKSHFTGHKSQEPSMSVLIGIYDNFINLTIQITYVSDRLSYGIYPERNMSKQVLT